MENAEIVITDMSELIELISSVEGDFIITVELEVRENES